MVAKKKSSDTLATVRKTKPKDGKHGSDSSYRYPEDCPKLPDDKNWVRAPAPAVDASSTMDPLIAAIYHNSTHSPLMRLPDKVLEAIMRYLDNESLHSLRNTSRTLSRLSSSDEFKKRRVDSNDVWGWYSKVSNVAAGYYRRDAYCPACAHIRERKREDPRFEALFHQNLWCAACAEDHPAALFSASQRREPDDSRICVGHEGYFRICQHRTITWLDVQEWTASLAHLEAYGVNGIRGRICKHPDHSFTCNYKIGEVALDLTGRPDDLHISLTSRLHLPDLQERPSSLDVRRTLEAAQEAGAKYLGPPGPPGNSTHMTMFDPNNCNCLVYPGSELVEMPLGKPSVYACRHRVLEGETSEPMASSYHFGSFTGYSRSRSRVIDYSFQAGKCHSKCGKLDLRYTTRIWLWELDKDNGQKIHHTWYRAVNPESYGMTEDAESRHILWCPDVRCRNYHGNSGIDRFWGWKKR